MKIVKYTKLKNGQYKLTFDNDTNALLHEDLILKYALLINKELNNKELERMLEENNLYVAYDLALKYLKTKMRSTKEIREYLIKKDFKTEYIDKAIELLEKQKYLNDDFYCEAYINDRINLSSDGPYKIMESLKKIGISNDIIQSHIIVFEKELEISRIEKIVTKQVKQNHNKSLYFLKKKLVEYLTNLGYTKELVIRCVNEIKIDDTDILKKEYDKIYSKLSRKYSGKELEYKVKQKMYQKGFFQD